MDVACRARHRACPARLRCAAGLGLRMVDLRRWTIRLPAGTTGIRLQDPWAVLSLSEPGLGVPLQWRAMGLRLHEPGTVVRLPLCGLVEHVDTIHPLVPEHGHSGSQRGRHRPDGTDYERTGVAGGRPASQRTIAVRSQPAPSVGLRLWRASLRILWRPVVRLSRYSSVFIWRAPARHAVMVGGAAAEALAWQPSS